MMSALAINYTGRIEIEPHEIEATYVVENDQYELTLKWLLSHYGLPESCKLFIEMKGGSQTTETRRFELGMLGDGQGEKKLSLAYVRNPELIKIRFGVVLVDSNGLPMIKADRDKISPLNLNENNRSRSLLKMVKSPDLTVPWRMEFNDDEPVLMISDRQELFHNLRDTSPLFTPLVLPDVVRQIFEWMALSDVDYTSEVMKQWVKYFENLSCPSDFIEIDRSQANEDEIHEVMNMSRIVSEEFSKKFKIIDAVASTFDREGD
jgi:hypothetical protein